MQFEPRLGPISVLQSLRAANFRSRRRIPCRSSWRSLAPQIGLKRWRGARVRWSSRDVVSGVERTRDRRPGIVAPLRERGRLTRRPSLSFAKTASDSVDGRPVMLVTGPAGDETGRAGVPGGAVGILERATEGDGAWRWDESELTKRERRAGVAAKPPPVIAGECRSLGADVARARDPHGRPRALPPATHRLRGARALVGAAFHRPARLHLHAARSPGVVAPLQGRRAPEPLLPPERLPLVPGRRLGIRDRELIGLDNLMWGSDYPHTESTFPRSRKILERILDGVPPAERRKITSVNAARLYDCDLD